jgi:MerR family redox-sensitive transcriptional activator SoxR
MVKSTSCQARLSIGELARAAGKAPSAIRYYERLGLLGEVTRVEGRRRYPPETLRTLAVIDTAQRAGLSLGDVRLLLEASPDDAARIERLRELAERRLPEVEALIERATLVRRWLELAADCVCPTLEDCPLFEEPSPLPAAAAGLSRARPPARERPAPGGRRS